MKRLHAFPLLFIFAILQARGLEVKAKDPFIGLEWTFETTEGFQNIVNFVLSKESGTQTPTTEALSFAGILFHSNLQTYTNTRSYIKCAFNLGFTQKPHFFWSESADVWLNDDFSDSVRSIEFDAQFLLPLTFTDRIELRPFVGYSFIDYTYEYDGFDSTLNRFNTFVVGAQYSTRLYFRWLQMHSFISYSPVLYANYENEFLRYLYYGGEIITTTHPVGFTFFLSFRKAFRKNRYYFDIEKYNENTVFDMFDLGMSFHISL
ncbi:MAG: hypothetical protein K6G80_09730 [Treponema sp.]|nr:hypothetical protein [Treponema sp.]